MKYLNFLWLLLGWTSMSYAQTVTIIDQQTEKPLEGVVLISESPQASTITNAKGQADISAFKEAENIKSAFLAMKRKFSAIAKFNPLILGLVWSHLI